MAMPPCGTFEYVTTVPSAAESHSFPWRLQLAEDIEPRGDSLLDDRLLGYAPLLSVSEESTIPDPTDERQTMTLSTFTLRASSRKNARMAEAWFHIDQQLTMLLQPGDLLRLSRSGMGGIGLALQRGEKLVFAVGTILGHSLGKGIRVNLPYDAMRQAGRFDTVPFEDQRGKPLLVPLEIHVGEEMQSIFRGKAEVGEYQVWVEGGTAYSYYDMFLAISAKGLCDITPSIASAIVLKGLGLGMTKWPKRWWKILGILGN